MYRPAFDRVADPASGSAELRHGLFTDRWAVYLPLGFLVFIDLWWKSIPLHAGSALAGFGFAIAVLLVRADISQLWEKVLWGVFAAGLLTLEMHAAHQARVQADSFLRFRLLAPDQSTVDAHGLDPIHSAVMTFIVFDRFAKLQDDHTSDGKQFERIVQTVPVGDFGAGGHKDFSLLPVALPAGIAHYRITFTTPEGFWWEDLQTASVGGRLLQASRISRYRSLKTQTIAEQEDTGFPHGPSGGVDWKWAAREP